MGGIATVVAAAILSIVFIQVFTTYYGASVNNSNTLLNSIQQQAARDAAIANEHISVTSINPSRSSVTVNILNTGQTSIAARNFSQMDVIMTYTLRSNNQLTTIWFAYNTSSLSTNAWSVSQVLIGSYVGQVVNPINLPQATHGEWNPGETLVITIRLASSSQVQTYYPVTVEVTTPHGVSSSLSQ